MGGLAGQVVQLSRVPFEVVELPLWPVVVGVQGAVPWQRLTGHGTVQQLLDIGGQR